MPVASRRLRTPRVYYPLWISLYPIFYLYAANISLVIESEVLLSLVIAEVVTAVIFVGLVILLRDRLRASAITLVTVIVFFSYGHLAEMFTVQNPGLVDLGPAVLVAVGLVLIGIILWRKSAARHWLTALNPLLHLMTLTLLVFPLIQIGGYFYRTTFTPVTGSDVRMPDRLRSIATNDAAHPDVYFVILDGYSSNDFWMKNWGYDNSDFTNELEKRGFKISYNARSNYGATLASIPATLNMRYIDPSESQGNRDSDLLYARSLFANNQVAYQFQQTGYKYVFMLSGFSLPSVVADLNIEFFESGPKYIPLGQVSFCEVCVSGIAAGIDPSWYYRQPFLPFLLETTLLRSMAARVEEMTRNPEIPLSLFDSRRAMAIWDEAAKIANMPEATFTFIHLMKPHDPINFDKGGNILPTRKYASDEEKAPYFFDQLQFVNRRTLEMVDAIVEKSSTPPIIIIQGDHATRLGDVWNRERTHLTYFDILSAFYFPGGDYSRLPENITSVNTFRVVFDTFFGEKYELLPNRHFDLPLGYEEVFNQIEVFLDDN